MKSATERDIAQMRAELTRGARAAHSACINLAANMHSAEAENAVGAVVVALSNKLSFFSLYCACKHTEMYIELKI